MRALGRVGFERVGQRGSQVKLRSADGLVVIVPMHRELRAGTLRSVIPRAASPTTRSWSCCGDCWSDGTDDGLNLGASLPSHPSSHPRSGFRAFMGYGTDCLPRWGTPWTAFPALPRLRSPVRARSSAPTKVQVRPSDLGLSASRGGVPSHPLGVPSIPSMQGSLRSRGRGVWEVRIYLGRVPDTGRKRYRSTTVRGTRREAERAARTLPPPRMGVRTQSPTKGFRPWRRGSTSGVRSSVRLCRRPQHRRGGHRSSGTSSRRSARWACTRSACAISRTSTAALSTTACRQPGSRRSTPWPRWRSTRPSAGV